MKIKPAVSVAFALACIGTAEGSAPTNCEFSYYVLGDEKGKALAQNAKKECERNNILKAQGRSSEISLEHYTYWKDHRQIAVQRREAAVTRGAAAATPKYVDLNCRPDGLGNLRCTEW